MTVLNARRFAFAVILYGAFFCAALSGGFCANQIDIVVSRAPGNREVRYVSGGTVYIEGLLQSRWVGLYWSASGRINRPYWQRPAPAFELEILHQPADWPPKSLSGGWEWLSASEMPGTDQGTRQFVVKLSNQNDSIVVSVHTLLDGTPVLTRWLDITNTSEKPLALMTLYAWSGRLWDADAPVTLGHSLKWHVPWEGWFGWTPLGPGKTTFRNDKGLVWDDPYFVLHNQANGEYFFGQLSWPVNYTLEFQKGDGLSFKIGPSAAYALRTIAPGETITTPAVHLGYVAKDFDATVQAMHTHVRRSVLLTANPKRSYLVQYLFNEDHPLTVYRGDDYNETNVKKAMDVAAAAGMEVVIVDGPTWAEGYGNWVPKKVRFPRGFEPVREYAHQKGLLFGLYAEVEGGRGDWSHTQAFQDHPTWFLRRNPDYPWDNLLDLSKPEPAAFAESELTGIIDRNMLDMYRHDQNGCFGSEGSETRRMGFIENDYWRYYEAWNAILERTHAKYPDLILQQASGGGSRLELGTVAHWHENYTSDRSFYPYVYRMASGLSVYLPPEILVTPNGMAGPNQPDLDTMLRSAYALGNTPMIFNGMLPKSVEGFTPELRAKFLHYANLYTTFIRPLLPTCKVYHHAPVSATGGVEAGNWFAMEFTSPDETKAWATIVRLSKTERGAYVLKLKGLDGKKKYRATFDNSGKTEILEGSRLMREGLTIRPPENPASELVLLEAQ